MSFSLQVVNGDLAVQGSQMGIVYGVDKLKQDLTLWMVERYGIDRFHPGMGSYFQNYIGGIISYATQAMVRNEAERIVDNYTRVQRRGLREAPSLYSLSELLNSINSINVGVGFDTVSVAVSVSNAQQQSTTVAVTQGT
jgi:hypothetical protein